MRKITYLFLITFCFIYTLSAQVSPFLYTITPQNFENKSFLLNYETTYGQRTFEPIGVDDLAQNIGFQTNVGENFILIDRTGMAFTNKEIRLSQQLELLYNFFSLKENDILNFSGGFGYLHEYNGTNVLISRFLIGKDFNSWQVYSNVLFEHAFSDVRDAIDLTTSLGFSYDLYDNLEIAVEAVGQDLEGFWDEEEMEGGAILYFGPNISYIIPQSSIKVTFGGGEIIRATSNANLSLASRQLPIVKDNGYIFKGMINIAL